VPRRKAIDKKRYETTEYWNQLLSDAGLSVEAGRDERLIYVDPGKASLISDLQQGAYNQPKRKKPHDE
jgi:hypothetical protein